MKTRRHTRRHRKHTGAGYGFGGSILSDSGGANAGNVQWNNNTGTDCAINASRAGNGFAGGKRHRSRRHRGGMMNNAALADRGGQNLKGGRRHSRTRHLKKRVARRGGAYVDYAQQAPRTGYGFNGQGVAGTSDTVPY